MESISKLIDNYLEATSSTEELKKLVITIARNQLNDWLEKHHTQKRGAGQVESLEALPPGQEFASADLNPAEAAEAAETALLVNEALQAVPEKYRNVLTDTFFLGLKQQEIADKRGLKLGSIGVYLDRGLEALEPGIRKMGLL